MPTSCASKSNLKAAAALVANVPVEVIYNGIDPPRLANEILPEDFLVPVEDSVALHLWISETLGHLPEVRSQLDAVPFRYQPLNRLGTQRWEG